MRKYNMAWRNRGTDRSKTFMERIARFAIAKVWKNLMPMFIRKSVQEYTDTEKPVRRRGGARNQKFNRDIHVKKPKDAEDNKKGTR